MARRADQVFETAPRVVVFGRRRLRAPSFSMPDLCGDLLGTFPSRVRKFSGGS
jgi:hypothetical protein